MLRTAGLLDPLLTVLNPRRTGLLLLPCYPGAICEKAAPSTSVQLSSLTTINTERLKRQVFHLIGHLQKPYR